MESSASVNLVLKNHHVFLFGRMLAHAFVDQERKKDEQERQAKSSWWPFGW